MKINLVQTSIVDDQQREKLSRLDFRSLPSVYQQALLEVRATSENRDNTK